MYNDFAGVSGIFALMAGFVFVAFLISIVFYIFLSLGLHKLAVNRKLENPWLAWIPIANLYILGHLAGGSIVLFEKKVEKLELVLPVAFIGVAVLSAIPVIGQLLCLAFGVFTFCVLYQLYKIYKPESAMLYTILSIFIAPFMIFAIRNNHPSL